MHESGHARVSATAGSGKTTTMLYRILHLLENGVQPERLLTVMFNRSAQEEFANRLSVVCQGYRKLPETRTFHGFGNKITKHFVEKGLLRPARLITSDLEVQHMAKAALKEVLGRSPESNDPDVLASVLSFIEAVKCGLDTPREVFKRLGLQSEDEFLLGCYERFEGARRRLNLRTYSDLIWDPCQVMLNDRRAVSLIENKVDHIIIDEYQDICDVQQQMMVWVAGHRAKVMVIGDPQQCIYVWRGARPEYIVSGFDRDFGGSTHYKLSKTFRYGHAVSLVANHVISKNPDAQDSFCISGERTPATNVSLHDEGQGVSGIINAWISSGGKLSEIAILLRLFAHGGLIELELLEKEIPYRIVGGQSILDSNVTLAALGFLHLANGSLFEQEAVERYLGAMIQLPPTGLDRDAQSELIRKIIERPDSAMTTLAQWPVGDKAWISNNLRTKSQLWRDFSRMERATPSHQAIAQFWEWSGAEAYLKKTAVGTAGEEKGKVLQGLKTYALRLQVPIPGLLQKISKLVSSNVFRSEDADAVLMTSVHRSKGLEWPLVVLPGLAEGSFPHIPKDKAIPKSHFEDERRLFYVAVTRAQQQLHLLAPRDEVLAKSIDMGSQKALGVPTASRFLTEANLGVSTRVANAVYGHSEPLPPAAHPDVANRYLGAVDCEIRVPVREVESPPAGAPVDPYGFCVGAKVHHPAFGEGMVTHLDDQMGRLEVYFDRHGGAKILQTRLAVDAGLKMA